MLNVNRIVGSRQNRPPPHNTQKWSKNGQNEPIAAYVLFASHGRNWIGAMILPTLCHSDITVSYYCSLD